MKRHIIGCLLDLLENPKTMYHILEWRTKKDSKKGIEHLLISIWCDEEIKLGVPQGKSGSVPAGLKFPLLGKSVSTVYRFNQVFRSKSKFRRRGASPMGNPRKFES